jgi:hypothetical protein
MNAYCIRCRGYTHRCHGSHVIGASFPGMRRAVFLPASAPAEPVPTKPGLLRSLLRLLLPRAR